MKTETPKTLTHIWRVEMHPRNLPPTKERAVIVEVQATSKQEAINKAISEKPGHTWGEVTQWPDAPHILVQGGQPVKAAHEGSKIHERPNLVPNPGPELTPTQERGLWAEAWEPTRREGEELSIAQIVQEAIGSASMCWEYPPLGTFDSERASWVAGGAINAIERVVFWQTGFQPGGKSMTMGEAELKVQEHADEIRKAEAKAAYLAANEMDMCVGIAQQSEEDRLAWVQRSADKAAVVDLILSYRNVAGDEEKLRQIRVVMD